MSSMRPWPLAAIVSLLLLPAGLPAETGRQDYQALIDEYRRGDAEAAVTKLAAIGPDNIDRLRPATSVEQSPWDWAASILLRTEAKHRYFYTHFGWSFLRAPRSQTIDSWNRVRDRFEGPSLREVRALVGHAVRTGDERLQAYCRAWYIAALHGSARKFFIESRDLFRGEPEVLLARGRYLEFWMGPDPRYVRHYSGWAMDWGRYFEFHLDAPEWNEEERDVWVAWETPWFRTVHGTFGTWARRALETYREALDADPDLTEARLRLGRVLYLVSRHGDALGEFERTLADARTRREVGTAYLAALFAGQLHEFEGRTIEAAASYRAAIAVCPSCPSAPVALLSLYLASGGDAEGWQAMDTLLRDAGDDGNLATDPSATYVIFPGSFLQGQRYVALRPWVRVE
jgi:tetratricopeptide (TPR) repeat protein